MKTLLRMSGVVFFIALLTFAVIGLRHTDFPSDVLNAVREREDLKQWQESIERYRESQYDAVQDWLDQRCTLEQTMGRFQELDREYAKAWPAFPNLMQQRLPQSDDERHYLFILGRVEIILHERPEELAEARQRQEEEYHLLGRDKVGSEDALIPASDEQFADQCAPRHQSERTPQAIR